MAPEITPRKELMFTVRNGDVKLRIQEVAPKSDADFVATVSGSRGDVGSFTTSSTATSGVAEDAFYAGANVVRDFAFGGSLHVKDSKGERVTLVQQVQNKSGS